MKNNETLIRRLTEQGNSYEKKGYGGDACFKWFMANSLKLLSELSEGFKGLEKQMKYLWQTLDELKETSEKVEDTK